MGLTFTFSLLPHSLNRVIHKVLRLASKLGENQGWDFQIEHIKKKKIRLRVVCIWPMLWWLGMWARTRGLLAMTIGHWLWLLILANIMAMAIACDYAYWLWLLIIFNCLWLLIIDYFLWLFIIRLLWLWLLWLWLVTMAIGYYNHNVFECYDCNNLYGWITCSKWPKEK